MIVRLTWAGGGLPGLKTADLNPKGHVVQPDGPQCTLRSPKGFLLQYKIIIRCTITHKFNSTAGSVDVTRTEKFSLKRRLFENG
jgi:hypothetical protein